MDPDISAQLCTLEEVKEPAKAVPIYTDIIMRLKLKAKEEKESMMKEMNQMVTTLDLNQLFK